jgi:adenylyltransferase/sulfurtransferase
MNDEQLLRYSRQILLADWDIDAQLTLGKSTALVIGAGGLGSPVALYLAAAGVGTLMVADDDVVELSNLQRQIAHTTSSLGQLKVASMAESVNAINPSVRFVPLERRLEGEDLHQHIEQADVVVDCSDNFSTRYAVNERCYLQRTPLVSGAAIRWEGQLCIFDYEDDSPCYQCLYQQGSDEALSCHEAGVFAPLTGVIGSLQAVEAAKLLAGIPSQRRGKFLTYDARSGEFRDFKFRQDPKCPTCHQSR